MTRLSVVERTKLNLSEVTILLKGGSELEVDVLLQVFAGFGARQLRRAVSGPALREATQAEPIDLLVVDAASGLEESLASVRELRQMTTPSRYAPVVLTTANVIPSVLNAARDAGVNYVVAKPLAPRILFERLVWIVKDTRPFIEADSYAGPDRRVRSLGPPAGLAGRRADDLPPEVGDASTPNLSQSDIDAMMNPVRRSL